MRTILEIGLLGATGLIWAYVLFRRADPPVRIPERLLLWLAVMVSQGLLTFVLDHLADPDVTNPEDLTYMPGCWLGGILWLYLAARSFLVLRLSVAADALEARNPSAVYACSGALFGAGLVYVGANIGSGDDGRTTLIAALIGYSVWFACWWVLESRIGLSASITRHRRRFAGARLGILLAANGGILGWAVAGDWISFAATLHDLVLEGWPALALTVVFGFVESILQGAGR